MELKPGYKLTEVGVIPEDWDITTIHGLASPARNAIVGGPFGSDLVSADYVSAGVPVIRGQNMGSQWVSGDFAFVADAKANSLESNLARHGDLVFTQRGTLGQVSLVPEYPFDRYLVSQSQMKVTLNRKAADPIFFYYVFSSSEQQTRIQQNTIQTGVPHINIAILRGIPVQRPRLCEQEAIADALSDADALIESLEHLIAKKRLIKQGAIGQLLSAREGWNTKKLLNIAPLQRGFDLPNHLLKHGRYPVVYSNGILNYHERLMVKGPGLVTGRSGTLGAVQFILEDFWPHNTTLWVTNFKGNNPKFVYYLYSAVGLERLGTGSGVPTLNRNDVHEFRVSLPENRTEQTAIAAILSDMDSEIAALEAKLAKARQIKQGMMQNLLTGKIRLV